MFDEFLNKAADLRAKEEPFALAMVVRCEPPVSGKPGDKALIRADGTIWGWIGGGCSQPVVIKEALEALRDGKPRLIRVSPAGEAESEAGVVSYTMTCHSGGALDIYLEPVLPKPQLVIFGRSLIARALARLGQAMNYTTLVVAPGAHRDHFPHADVVWEEFDSGQIRTTPQTYVIVATQGQGDEEAIEQAVGIDAPYIAFVASKVKARKVLDDLSERGMPAECLNRVKAPAGLDIGAVSAEEVAVSILAEIVQVRTSAAGFITEAEKKKPSLTVVATEVKDPICGMLVDVRTARHRSEYQGQTFYFCCAHCQHTFEKQPGEYVG